ncbi:hypothetical protein Scep_012493 [Stephania cephalantha]|uniref:Uncharacterized protein n=1 Tax=Stephania cephalantha TaxID=152367 RepID=A0AAP0JG25_9MAGN
MDFGALEAPLFSQSRFLNNTKPPFFRLSNRQLRLSSIIPTRFLHSPARIVKARLDPCVIVCSCKLNNWKNEGFDGLKFGGFEGEAEMGEGEVAGDRKIEFLRGLVKRGLILAAIVCGVLVVGCRRVLANEGVVNSGYGVLGQSGLAIRGAWPKLVQVLGVVREQGLVLAALLGLSAFFSMAETSITTLWPWKVRELAEKEPENGVFKMLRSDVTRFLTTILIGTTYVLLVVNIGATALVTEAATAIFGEAGVSAATGIMTVAILLLTEITPKSIAVHHATEVVRFVVRPVAWLSLILYPVGRVVTFLSMGILKMLGLKGRSEPYVTEEELKLMLRGAELSGAIEEEEQLKLSAAWAPNFGAFRGCTESGGSFKGAVQDMIENVLEIKDTHVREVMTPLVDVVAIDSSATLIDFHNLWVTHQYSRVPVFEQRIDNIVGIAYAMDLLGYVQKGDPLESSKVGEMAHKPAYFVPDSMSVWDLLREFRIRKVHMAVVLNEYGGTVGIVTLEDVVEEIVGEIFDENDSKEEIQRKTGYVVMQAEGIFDVDANTSIYQLSEEMDVKLPEGQYETVSGFVCEAFGYIPRKGENIEIKLEKANREENDEYNDAEASNEHEKEKHQVFRLEILDGNARKVSAVRFKRIDPADAKLATKEVARVVPRIMKRKWSNREDADSSDSEESKLEAEIDGSETDVIPLKQRVEDSFSDGNIIVEHENNLENSNKQ